MAFTQSTPGMNLSAGVLRRIARLAHDRITTTGDRETHIDMDAVVAILCSAAALEAFINELGALAETASPSDPPAVSTFASLIRDLERKRRSTKDKFAAAGQAFLGKVFAKGTEPFQSFDLLFALRDEIMHVKGETLEFDAQGRAIKSSIDGVIKALRSKNITAEYDPSSYVGTSPSLFQLIGTRAVARWACNVAADVVAEVLGVIPESDFKKRMESIYRQNFRRVDSGKDGT